MQRGFEEQFTDGIKCCIADDDVIAFSLARDLLALAAEAGRFDEAASKSMRGPRWRPRRAVGSYERSGPRSRLRTH